MVVGEFTNETDLLVIGGGPGGYSAAFRAGAHGIQTTLIESMDHLGGVCLHRGCIPSKTYLSMAETLHQAQHCRQMGIELGEPRLDVNAMRGWKQQVVSKLAAGLDSQCKKYKVERVKGTARFEDARTVAIEGGDVQHIKFRRAIIATGSRSIQLKGIQIESPRVLTSRTALELPDVPQTLLVIGAGYIGLELGMVYAGFGSKVTVVEMLDGIIPGADRDLVRPLEKRVQGLFAEVCLETKVVRMKEVEGGIELAFEGKHPPRGDVFEKVLVAVGRVPNSAGLGLEKAGVQTDERGFIKVDSQLKTTAPRIYAIGDVIGNPMLAHKASHEGHVVAELLAGKDVTCEPRAIPAVVFTDPEIAWAGYTEAEAKQAGLDITIKKLPWSASGRAMSLGRTDGVTKLIVEKQTQRLLGIGICGLHAGEMIAEGVLALEMGAVAYDLAWTIHPHPTLSETIAETAAMLL
ncbi:MAG TPA: dihydrolipoyl dehydrogenase [Phycisphaerae bacterium]|nr:dihydrolipoyl dehydrogenase [Phycisphaerae bacterium]HNU44012.1 dihydrolipoyl dehydrogenase [Phycisphaerae bacterium]